MSHAYYNENDPFAAAWLRELIAAGLIADGEVDDRSIADVTAADVRGFRQCHFFAGIGGWSHALRLAGWPDDRAVWTGSCPCQPWSQAGGGARETDTRDLWPTWFQLVQQCQPATVFGEQVASADGLAWLDRVYVDLETSNYAVASTDLCAAGVGGFHIRQRLWFVGHATSERYERIGVQLQRRRPREHQFETLRASETAGAMVHAAAHGLSQRDCVTSPRSDEKTSRLSQLGFGAPSELGDTESTGPQGQWREPSETVSGESGRQSGLPSDAWANAEWLPCVDGKARPIESGTFPLAYGVPARVGRLRGYGNAIVPQVAQVFIEAYMSVEGRPAPPRTP